MFSLSQEERHKVVNYHLTNLQAVQLHGYDFHVSIMFDPVRDITPSCYAWFAQCVVPNHRIHMVHVHLLPIPLWFFLWIEHPESPDLMSNFQDIGKVWPNLRKLVQLYSYDFCQHNVWSREGHSAGCYARFCTAVPTNVYRRTILLPMALYFVPWMSNIRNPRQGLELNS
jgi:hypothetical protein